MSLDILVIPDTQCRAGVPTDHFDWIGKYIVKYKPHTIIHMGDHFDFPALSKYATKREKEGARIVNDLRASDNALARMFAHLWDDEARAVRNKKKMYIPDLYFLKGNHENRMSRLINDMPELEGALPDIDYIINHYGFKIVDFLKPLEINGVMFSHYIQNPYSGEAVGGSADNMMNKVGQSFVVGHRQGLHVTNRYTPTGRQLWGIVAGSCYLHDEDYKGPQGNHHWRGIVHLHDVRNGSFEPEFINMGRLRIRTA